MPGAVGAVSGICSLIGAVSSIFGPKINRLAVISAQHCWLTAFGAKNARVAENPLLILEMLIRNEGGMMQEDGKVFLV